MSTCGGSSPQTIIVVLSTVRVAVLLEGKGGGRKGRYQGKVSSLERRGEAYQLIRDFRK